MLFSYAIEGFLGWLSRFKLIRLRRISLATLPRYGRMGGRALRIGWAEEWVDRWAEGWI